MEGESEPGDLRRYTANQRATIRAYDRFYNMMPSFLDLFPDEDAFLSFAAMFVASTLIVAFVLSRFVHIRPPAHG